MRKITTCSGCNGVGHKSNSKKCPKYIHLGFSHTSTLQNRGDVTTTKHFSIKIKLPNNIDHKWKRGKCRYCNKKTAYFCPGCNAWFCIDRILYQDGSNSSCFELIHT